MWTGYCLYIAGNIFIQDIGSNNLASTSHVDLGLVLLALKLIGTRQNISNWFLSRLEYDISQARVGSLIPDEVKRIVHLSVCENRILDH
jgi:hypothetical protein